MADYVGDPYVFYTQQWLNENYGNDSRFNRVTENGKTGWATIYALTRALQIELGIFATADNFGPTTIQRFNEKFPNGIIQQDSGDERESKIYGIIQGALLCKGYSTGVNSPTLHFYNGTGSAIKKLKEDANCKDRSSKVTLNVMQALLSMDYFVLNTLYGGTSEVRKMQQYLNANYEDYIGLRPCDGIYSRRTNTALIYALQAEEKLPIDTANGNFGPTTQKCCPSIPYDEEAKDYFGDKYTSLSISKFVNLMKIALCFNGYGYNELNGFFDGKTQNSLMKFKEEYALDLTNDCSKGTWLSLLVSSGDPDRDALACDCATILDKEKAKTLYDNGYRYVGRYLTGTYIGPDGKELSKALTNTEISIIINNGLNFFPIYEGNGTYIEYFTEEQAEKDVERAYTTASDLGIESDNIIYFAVDCDPLDTEIDKWIVPYFRKINDIMNSTYSKKYKIGIYATRNACTKVSNQGLAWSSFVSDMSVGYSGNLGFNIPKNWAFDQFANVTLGSGNGKIEIDKDAYSGRYEGIDFIPSQMDRIFSDLSDIYDLAFEYSSNDKEKSNLLLLQYFREQGGYGGELLGGGSTKLKLLWNLIAGDIDDTFTSRVESKLNYINCTFLIQTEKGYWVNYDFNHFAATVNALLYMFGDSSLDTFADIYAGWGGDMLTFAIDIKDADESSDDDFDINEWARSNICSQNASHFSIEDYYADIDAVNVANIMKNDGFNFIEAFNVYFNTPLSEEPYFYRRTTRFLSSYGTTYFETILNKLESDDLDIFKNVLASNTDDKYFKAAIDAFRNYVYNEYAHSR